MIKELNTAVVVTFAPIVGFSVGVIIGSMILNEDGINVEREYV